MEYKVRVPGQEGDQRNLERDCGKRLSDTLIEQGEGYGLIIDGGSRYGMTDAHNRCEWVNVFCYQLTQIVPSKIQRAVNVCVCALNICES